MGHSFVFLYILFRFLMLQVEYNIRKVFSLLSYKSPTHTLTYILIYFFMFKVFYHLSLCLLFSHYFLYYPMLKKFDSLLNSEVWLLWVAYESTFFVFCFLCMDLRMVNLKDWGFTFSFRNCKNLSFVLFSNKRFPTPIKIIVWKIFQSIIFY